MMDDGISDRKKKDNLVGVKMSFDEVAVLRALSQTERRTVSGMLRYMMYEYIQQCAPKDPPFYRRMLSLIEDSR